MQTLPEPYMRLYDLQTTPASATMVRKTMGRCLPKLKGVMLDRFQPHPERGQEPGHASIDEVLSWYLRPLDALAVGS
jgi:hypothetical protein